MWYLLFGLLVSVYLTGIMYSLFTEDSGLPVEDSVRAAAAFAFLCVFLWPLFCVIVVLSGVLPKTRWKLPGS